MLLSTLGANLLGNLLAGKRIVRAGYGNKEGKRNCKSWLWKRMGFLMPPHPLTNFELEKYYQNEPGFNGVYSRNNLLKTIKDGAYVINLGLFCNRSEIVYFNSFGVEHVPEEIKEFVGNKNIKKKNIFREQANNLVMFGYFRIGLRPCFLLMILIKTTS